jgi:arabinose-5-phosphate isomerase
MSTEAAPIAPAAPLEQLRYAREIIRIESQALASLATALNARFCEAVELIFRCQGSVLVSGMGKAGLVGQKISATLASTGTRSHFLHPGEAFHGDLGRIHRNDVLLILSQSGETEEVTRLLPSLREFGVDVIAITAKPASPLARAAAVVLELGAVHEACALGLAPSTSTTAMLALGDALALVVSRLRDFQADDFARFHPGGSLGRQLSRVEDVMRPLDQCRVASDSQTVREVFTSRVQSGRRTGAIMLIDNHDRLTGLFTDSDLARLFEHRREDALDQPIRNVMTANPTTAPAGARTADAIEILAERRISELPVISSTGAPVGLIDITDLAGMLPEGASGGLTALPAGAPPTISLFTQTADPSEA